MKMIIHKPHNTTPHIAPTRIHTRNDSGSSIVGMCALVIGMSALVIGMGVVVMGMDIAVASGVIVLGVGMGVVVVIGVVGGMEHSPLDVDQTIPSEHIVQILLPLNE